MLRLPAILLVLLVLLALAAGSACAGSPIPEPPNLDVARVVVVPASSGSGSTTVMGESGAATLGSVVWGVNFETVDVPVTGAVGDDGSFALLLGSNDGDELRLQARTSAERSAPIDRIAPDLVPADRPLAGCLTLEPPLELDFAATSTAAPLTREIAIDNECGSTVTVDALRSRSGSAAFVAVTSAPFDVASGMTATIEVRFEPSSSGEHEEILFIEVGAPSMERRPITLIGTAR